MRMQTRSASEPAARLMSQDMLTPDSAPRAGDERLARERPAAYGPAPELQEHFRELVGAVEEYAIFLLDAKGDIQSWNAGAERIKGYQAQEIVGRHFSVFYPPE